MGIGRILEGKDVVLAAETGSGKTLAYLLPIITRILSEKQHIQSTTSVINKENILYDELENPKQYSKRSRIFKRDF